MIGASGGSIFDGIFFLHRFAKAAEDCFYVLRPEEIPEALLASGAIKLVTYLAAGDTTSALPLYMKRSANQVEFYTEDVGDCLYIEAPTDIPEELIERGTIKIITHVQMRDIAGRPVERPFPLFLKWRLRDIEAYSVDVGDCLYIDAPTDIPQELIDNGIISKDGDDIVIIDKPNGDTFESILPLFLKMEIEAYPDDRGEHAYVHSGMSPECSIRTPTHAAFILQKGVPIPEYFTEKGVYIAGDRCVIPDDMGGFAVLMPTEENQVTYCLVDLGYKIAAFDLHSDYECRKFMVELHGCDFMLLSEAVSHLTLP